MDYKVLPIKAPCVSGITSVPYKESYKLTQRALAALSAYRALEIGTTNCGPQILDISVSKFFVLILKSGPVFFK